MEKVTEKDVEGWCNQFRGVLDGVKNPTLEDRVIRLELRMGLKTEPPTHWGITPDKICKVKELLEMSGRQAKNLLIEGFGSLPIRSEKIPIFNLQEN